MAYVLYKQDKIGFIEATSSAHGRAPTDDELKVFHTQTCVPAKIEEYRAQALQLWDASLKIVVKNKLQEVETQVREGILNENVLAVLGELKAKRGARAWFADIFANLGVNIATILVIGALLGGYQALAKFNSNVEKLANVPTAPEPAPATGSTSAATNGSSSTALGATPAPKSGVNPPGSPPG